MAFKCQSTAAVFVSPMAVAEWSYSGYDIRSVHSPSCHLSGCFLEIRLVDFSEFWHGAVDPYEVVHDSPIFWKKFFLPPNLGKLAKNRFFEFQEKIGH